MAHATVPLNFNAFLEKAKLKDDGSNYTNWVLEAPLGARPATGATPDIVNAWQTRVDDYSIV